MATRVNRAATAGNKQGGKSKTRNRTTASYNTHKGLDSRRNQSVFEVHGKESVARRHNEAAGDRPGQLGFGSLADRYRPQRVARSRRVPRVQEAPEFDQPRYRKKKAPSGRGISGGKIYVAAAGSRSKPKKTGWNRG